MNLRQFDEISRLLQIEIDEHHIPGGIVTVYHMGKEIFQTCRGLADIEKGIDMGENTIFRMYSMSKPVTAVAAMIFMERGLLRLEDKVSKYLPEFTQMKVLEKGKIVSADRAITIKDLLHMTSGIVYPDPDPAGMKMTSIFDEIHFAMNEKRAYTTREVMKAIASCPLAFHPGEGWRYGLSADVLAAVLEVIADCKISELYKKEIFEPLDMQDTGFYVPIEKQEGFAQLYKSHYNEEKSIYTLEIDTNRHLGLSYCLKPPGFESGGAGICSTLRDYSRFARMLAGGGSYTGVKILERSTVEHFTHNELNMKQKAMVNFPQLEGYGYGYLMRTREAKSDHKDRGVEGEFGWDGWTGPYFTVDLKDNLTFLYLTQISGYSNWSFIRELRNAIYGAMD